MDNGFPELGTVVAVIGAVAVLALAGAALLLARTYRGLKRLNVPEGAGFLTTVRMVPLGLVVALDLLDLGLDVLSAPIIWVILSRLRLQGLRDIASFEALVPFTIGRNEKDRPDTYYEGIFAVMAGQIVTIDDHGLRSWRYWRLSPGPEVRYRRREEYAEQFRALLAQYQGFADVQMGIGMVVLGLASVIIGESLVGTRQLGLTIAGAVMGSILFRLLVAIALRAGLNPNDLKLITASFVLIALVLPSALKSLSVRKKVFHA